jgi:hypothetical protein
MQASAHERLTLPTAVPMAPCVDWEQDPGLEPAYNPVLGRIWILAESGLTPMMVLHDFMSKRIMPLWAHTRSAWLYTGVNDITQLERGDRSALSEEVLALVMAKLNPGPSSHDFITPPASCQPLCMDQAARSMLLVAMPLMDDVGITLIQRDDQSRGVQIPGAGAAGGQGGTTPSLAPSKGKGKVVRVICSDNEVSSDDDVPLQRWMRVRGRGKSTVGGPPPAAPTPRLPRQQRHRQRRPWGPAAARLWVMRRRQQGPLQ